MDDIEKSMYGKPKTRADIAKDDRIKELTELLTEFRDARAGTNEHGVYWLTDKLRKADAKLDDMLREV